MVEGGLDGFLFQLQVPSSETTTIKEFGNCKPCYWCLYFQEEERRLNPWHLKQYQSSQDSHGH